MVQNSDSKMKWCFNCYNNKLSIVVWTFLTLVLVANLAGVTTATSDFRATSVLADGEMETRIQYRGITGKETSVGIENGLKLRQVTDGRHFIQLIYDGDESLVDCEYIEQRNAVANFLATFTNDVDALTSNTTEKNVTIVPLEVDLSRALTTDNDNRTTAFNRTVTAPTWLDYARVKSECRRMHHELKTALKEKRLHKKRSRRSITKLSVKRRSRSNRHQDGRFIGVVAPGTKWCGMADTAAHYADLGTLSATDVCCRRHDHCSFNVAPFAERWGLWNTSPFTISHCGCDNRRNRRDLSDMLRIPGTKWCGKGRSARKYSHLGGFSAADKCCRTHDNACPFWIGALEEKYGLFNWRVNTLMHCGCDERFRACLKLSSNSVSNMVGKLFFNIVQTKCFVLKQKKVCKRRSWWGKCLKYRYKKQAHLRDNIPY